REGGDERGGGDCASDGRSWAFTAADNGAHSWTAKAFDAAGNSTTSAAVSLTVSIDTQAPSVAITSPPSGTTYNSAQTVSIAASRSDDRRVGKAETYEGRTPQRT